jgi:uncharacterized membrane protein YgaE (UPF0421/DUF939 family)
MAGPGRSAVWVGHRLRQARRILDERLAWTPPTSTEIALVGKAGAAAGLSWWLASLITGVSQPFLAPLTAIMTVQITVRASIAQGFQRTLGVMLGVAIAVGLGDAFHPNALTVAVLMGGSLAVAQLILRMEPFGATQVPITLLLVIAAVGSNPATNGWPRIVDTTVGAAVGVLVSALVLPASRLTDARQTVDRLGSSVADLLESMAAGVRTPWDEQVTSDWRRRARAARRRLVDEATEAVGSGQEAARWNMRDRRNVEQLARFELALPRLERAANGVAQLARDLDDVAVAEPGISHAPLPDMAELFHALAGVVRATTVALTAADDSTTESATTSVADALEVVRARRRPVARAALRQAEGALIADDGTPVSSARSSGEWLSYLALLVQVDHIAEDLGEPLPLAAIV